MKMSDSEIEDSFLVQALEEIEEKGVSTTPKKGVFVHTNNSHFENSNDGIEKTVSGPNIKSLHSSSTDADFRSNLLKSLISSRSCVTTSEGEKLTSKVKKHSDNFLNIKRKFCESDDGKVNSFERNKTNALKCLKTDDKVFKENNFQLDISPKCPVRSGSPSFLVAKKRKFPGPAGVLPHLGASHQNKTETNLCEATKEVGSDTDSSCSQNVAQEFLSKPWKQMKRDLMSSMTMANSVIQNYNIRSILRKASLQGHASIRKVSFIAVMVKTIDFSHLDATAIFLDETGEMNGTISKDVIEKYCDFISQGAVFVLKDATVLSPASLQPGISVIGQLKKHYLNMTINSVVAIYVSDNSDGVRKIEAFKLTEDFVTSILDSSENVKERRELIEIEDETRVPLFGTSVSVMSRTNDAKGDKAQCLKYAEEASVTKAFQNPFHGNTPKSLTPKSNSSHFQSRSHFNNSQSLGMKNITPHRCDESESARSIRGRKLITDVEDEDDGLDLILASIDVDGL